MGVMAAAAGEWIAGLGAAAEAGGGVAALGEAGAGALGAAGAAEVGAGALGAGAAGGAGLGLAGGAGAAAGLGIEGASAYGLEAGLAGGWGSLGAADFGAGLGLSDAGALGGMGVFGDLAGSAGGGGLGSLFGSAGNYLSSMTPGKAMGAANMLTGLYGLTQQQKLRKQMQPPDPRNLPGTPGYQAGLEAVQRSMAAQGYQGSGNMMAALQKYGGDAYQQNWQGNIASAQAGMSGLGGTLSAAGLISSGIPKLFGK